MINIFNDLLNFIFPVQCEVCGRLLTNQERLMCLHCYNELPRTNYQHDLSNPVAQLFWGRVRIIHATSFFFFFKGSIYQKLIHKLKYEGRKDIAYQMGRLFGAELKATFFAEADSVIAVPLHPERQKKRGYNQSEIIAMGISDILQIELLKGNLIRNKSTSTQTKKNRFERFLNMDGSFELKETKSLYGKKLILVDDVVTTGSTLEACAQVLLDSGCSDLGILTLGVA